MKTLVSIFVLFWFTAKADNVAVQLYGKGDMIGLRAHYLSKGRTLTEIRTSVGLLETLTELKVKCLAELRGPMVPKNCYVLLELEKANGFVTSEKVKTSIYNLNSVCKKRSNFVSAEELVKLSAKIDPEGFGFCRQVIDQRASDLEYAENFTNPRWTFSQRLKQ